MADRSEGFRRFLIVLASLAALIMSLVIDLVAWLNEPPHPVADFGLRAIPLLSASALLVALCVGFPNLFPRERLSWSIVVSVPAMHVALVVAVTRLLTTRPNALTQPLPAQKQIAFWLDPGIWFPTFIGEFGFFLLIFFLTAKTKPPASNPNSC